MITYVRFFIMRLKACADYTTQKTQSQAFFQIST
jgi:hypothetical protein